MPARLGKRVGRSRDAATRGSASFSRRSAGSSVVRRSRSGHLRRRASVRPRAGPRSPACDRAPGCPWHTRLRRSMPEARGHGSRVAWSRGLASAAAGRHPASHAAVVAATFRERPGSRPDARQVSGRGMRAGRTSSRAGRRPTWKAAARRCQSRASGSRAREQCRPRRNEIAPNRPRREPGLVMSGAGLRPWNVPGRLGVPVAGGYRWITESAGCGVVIGSA